MKINSEIYKSIHKPEYQLKIIFYRYTYIHRSDKICNQKCYHPKGCYIHHNSPFQVFYNECGKLIYFGYGFCNIHARKYHKGK